MISEDRVDQNYEFFRNNASKAAEARAHRLYLEAFSKHLLADLKTKSNAATVAEREDYALSHPTYKQHLDGLQEAIKRDEWYRWQKDSRLSENDAWRTQEANRRIAP